MEAIFMYKAVDKENWLAKDECGFGEEAEAIIEKTITLNESDFNEFCDDFMAERDFITDNLNRMWQRNGEWHCIAVRSEKSKFQVLVESEGYEYARYTAICPAE